MGRKPSMFSKNYRKELKKRRVKQYVIFSFLILSMGGSLIIYNNLDFNFTSYFTKKELDKEVGNIDKGEEVFVDEEKLSEEIEEVEVTVQLNSLIEVLIKVNSDNGNILSIECPEGVKGIISPTTTEGLIMDINSQDLYLVNNKGDLECITNPKYVSTENEIFTKEAVMQYNPSYRWIDNCGFIDAQHIAYSSQLPWIGEGDAKYLWIYSIEENTHVCHYGISGKTIEFGEVDPEGIEVKVDGKSIIVNLNGATVK